MKKVIVVGRVATLYAGALSLTADQAKTRIHCLRQDGEDFQILQPVQFINGEEFGYDGDPFPDLNVVGEGEGAPKAQEPVAAPPTATATAPKPVSRRVSKSAAAKAAEREAAEEARQDAGASTPTEGQ